MRHPKSYKEQCDFISKEALRNLETADADRFPKPWWRGNVLYEHSKELQIGGFFNLSDGEPNNPMIIGQYKIVAMAQAPEGYVSIISYESYAVGSQIPTITPNMLVNET